jgi:D-alanyl-D-alanine-carboxypeptidase/D-alanyl-D-alanine-endopeptidase
VAVLSNRSISADDIGVHLLDPKSPLTPKPAPKVERAAIDLPAGTLQKHVGVYAFDTAPQIKLTVTLENGALFVELTGQGKSPVYPESPTKVFSRMVDAQITFTEAANGQPAHLTLHQNGLNQKATKVQ